MSAAKSEKVAVAMSGGVDSSVVAALLLRQGFEVVGVTMSMEPPGGSSPDGPRWGAPLDNAARVAAVLGIEHRVVSLHDEFRDSVLRKCWAEYASGRTPNPCAVCNRLLKFGSLLDFAASLGASRMATGHYAIIDRLPGGAPALRRGAFRDKDQSYFLFDLSPSQLGRAMFPLGSMTKSGVRMLALELGLDIPDSEESQDACFAQAGENFPEALRLLFDEPAREGWFVGPDGRRLSAHKGVHKYTIGHRKGLGVALGKPAYVSSIDPVSGDVRLCVDESEIMSGLVNVSYVNWQQPEFGGAEFKCEVQIRYRHKAAPAVVRPLAEGRAVVEFETPQRAVTPGQAAVFYSGDMVVGGGWIDSTGR